MIKFLLLALCVLVGHLGWWVYCYNRVNSTALPRHWIKRCEVGIVGLILVIPVVMAVSHWSTLSAWWLGQQEPSSAPVLYLWSLWQLGTVILLGPLWLESRFWLIPPKNLKHEAADRVDVSQVLGRELTGKWISKLARRVPLNEITHLSVTRKTLVLERNFPFDWSRLTIGHLSDLHFTGQFIPEFYDYVVQRMQALQPDLIVITGDIIDKDYCLDWVEPILGQLSAPLGCAFVFGNHERRLSSIEPMVERMRKLGWLDLGKRDIQIDPASVSGDELFQARVPKLMLAGNEQPWYERHEGEYWANGPLAGEAADDWLKIGLSHTPDQHGWARQLGIDLLLAGHTHGGQVRIPGIGPLIAPSRYGSRFASGVFRLPPTLMHVSRGLAGTQPLRWRCPPEISLLTICPAKCHPASHQAPTAQLAEPLEYQGHLD